jgi:hypothetical protein
VHVRRALLLFAIVLGLAAIAASVSRTPEESGERAERRIEPRAPTVSPGRSVSSRGTAELSFDAGRDQKRRLDSGRPARVFVEVEEPGLVEIPDLGRNAPADPLTPARFELLVPDPGRFDIAFTAADGGEPEPAGTLVVRDPVE